MSALAGGCLTAAGGSRPLSPSLCLPSSRPSPLLLRPSLALDVRLGVLGRRSSRTARPTLSDRRSVIRTRARARTHAHAREFGGLVADHRNARSSGSY